MRSLLVVGLAFGAISTSVVAAAERLPTNRAAPAGEVVLRNGAGQVVMQRIEARLKWATLAVPEPVRQALRKLEADPTVKQGTAALFSGADRAAKLRAAEVLAAEMHLALYRVDLSVVVSEYIGETEKNLAQVFDLAKQGEVVLFFDEADALFGKRSATSDAHDRYANQEVSYLLQRIEACNGLAILATNQRAKFDAAFLRRFRHVIDFVPRSGASG
jgi:SpoVK/Ycf46/Vps4 family AAA+-type ATPase